VKERKAQVGTKSEPRTQGFDQQHWEGVPIGKKKLAGNGLSEIRRINIRKEHCKPGDAGASLGGWFRRSISEKNGKRGRGGGRGTKVERL